MVLEVPTDGYCGNRIDIHKSSQSRRGMITLSPRDVSRQSGFESRSSCLLLTVVCLKMVCPTNYEDMKAFSIDCMFEVRYVEPPSGITRSGPGSAAYVKMPRTKNAFVYAAAIRISLSVSFFPRACPLSFRRREAHAASRAAPWSARQWTRFSTYLSSNAPNLESVQFQ